MHQETTNKMDIYIYIFYLWASEVNIIPFFEMPKEEENAVCIGWLQVNY